MRLTLRTLLAYLDDSLEPAHAREIGAKIAESPVAAELAGRIREVLRRRRITAPQISGPGSGPDPNLTAEYLDNTMSPEAVAEFEQFCLESDVHLAEVSACHQILTLVLGEPAEVSTELRERMYAMGAVAAPDSTTEGNGQTREDGSPAGTGDQAAMPRAAAAGPPASFEDGLPQQLRRKSFAGKMIPAAIALICVGWLALLYSDPYLRGRSAPPEEPANTLADAGSPEEAAESDEQTAVTPEQAAPDNQSADADEVSVAGQESATPDGVPEEPTPGEPDVETTVPDATVAAEGAESATASPETPMPDPQAFQTPPPPPVQPANVVSTLYNSPEGILLQGNRDTGEWMVLPRHALLHAGDEVASPKPFTARLQIDNGVCIVTLAGGTRVRITGANAAGPFGFELLRGRMGVFRMMSDPPAEEPVAFGVQVRDRLYGVRLMEPNTWCGFEVVPDQPQGRTEPPQPATVGGGVFVARGLVELTDPAAGELQLRPENGWRSWTAEGAGQPLLAVPNWLSLEGAPLPTSVKRYVTLYAKEFPLDVPIWQSIPAIVRDRRPMLSRFAVETFALTGNQGELARALSAEHQESRRAAIVGLREWLLEDDSHPAMLPDELRLTFRDDAAAAIEELLWGYSRDDGRDPATSARLVDWLASDEVAIRELALFHIEMLTGHDNEFHPTASVAQRDAAIARWRDFLRRNRTLVPVE